VTKEMKARRGGGDRSGACAPSCCSYRKNGCGSPHPPNQNLVVLRSVLGCFYSQGRPGLAHSSATHISAAHPQGRFYHRLDGNNVIFALLYLPIS